ncbi:Tn3 family transposase [Streptosporangium sp. NPDC000396]|uniref:Tn3 family transposase n=1 Tax=Streptosporangium sp. NPDC000396 TaxID=3366185 RepID=UPI00367B53E9
MQIKLHRWATDNPGRRFDDLFNLVYDPAFLVHAWERVSSNAGARTAGVDRTTVAWIETRIGVETFLEEIRNSLKSGEFEPVEVRQVMIPKASGKRRKLGIPTVADRIVQASLKTVLEPIFEADFLPCSYGFRPNRRAHDAIAEIHRLASAPSNHTWVLEADITACFDEIGHTALMDHLRARIKDKRVCALVKAFLKAGVMATTGDREETPAGTPQGGIFSPLLANIALSALDEHFDRQRREQMGTIYQRVKRRKNGLGNWKLIRFATDIAIAIANATFTARNVALWGEGTTTVASDSTHVRAYDQDIFTEWHSRYGGRSILIHWHIERGSMVVHSQTLRASASEVHAMIKGAVRHGTTMKVEGNYVDSHGQTEIGFGVTRLLGFDLLPRIKQINKVKLYRVESGESDLYPRLTPAMTRPIRWDLIEQNYDQMIKYATAIKQGTASTEAILRRFTESASHPTYQAMLEVGRAQKTIFVARYLRLRELQREIQEGLNAVESSNGANSVIFYGKGGDIATNRREELEMSVLCLRILQAALVYINTLMLQDVLAEPEWAKLLKPADRRGLTPLFWQHVQPYGEVRLDVAKPLPLGGGPGAVQPEWPE